MITISADQARKFANYIFKYAWLVVICYLVLAILGFIYTTQNIGVNSNTSEMFDEELPFRKVRDSYKQAFPMTEDNIVIVVSGTVPELVHSISDSIANEFKKQPAFFEKVYQPTGEDFFQKNQLLFLDSSGLAELSKKAINSRPMMSFMMENYHLKGLFSFLGLMVRFSSPDQLQAMTPLFSKIDSTLDSTLQGKLGTMSWQSLLGDPPERFNHGYSFIQVKPVLNFNRLLAAKPAIEEARNIISSYQSHGLNVRITGKGAMTYEEMGSVMKGALQASMLALIAVSLVLWIGLRSFRLILATLLTLLVGLVLTAAFSTWAVGQLNMVSVAFAVLYIGLGVDYAIHICLRYRELTRETTEVKDAITVSISDIAPALLLSTLSTSIGFYAFVPTDFSGVSELGVIAGTGMFISLLVTLTLLPSLIWLLSAITSNKGSQKIIGQPPVIEKFRYQIRVATIILALIAIWLLPKAKFDYDPINLRDPKSESVATIRELMSAESFTPWSLNILTSDRAQSIAYRRSLNTLEGVERVLTVNSFIPYDQAAKLPMIRQMRGVFDHLPPVTFDFMDVAPEDQIKAIKDLGELLGSPVYSKVTAVAHVSNTLAHFAETLEGLEGNEKEQLLTTLQSNLLMTLPYNITQLMTALKADSISYESLPLSIKERWVTPAGIHRVQVLPTAKIQSNQQLRDFASTVQEVAPEATGDLMVTIASGDTVVKAFKQAVFYALIAITLILLLYLQNIKQGLFILMPLILAGAFTGAITVLLQVDFNFANVIAIPLLLGLGVDNGVHMVYRSKTDQSGQSLLQTSTARAILFSSLTTLFSFGSLALSPHSGTASMGWLLTFGVIFVLVATLIILPAFLTKENDH